jgi:hypothetical protein
MNNLCMHTNVTYHHMLHRKNEIRLHWSAWDDSHADVQKGKKK